MLGVFGVKDKMVGAMDLGGGSTQITFVPTVTKVRYIYYI